MPLPVNSSSVLRPTLSFLTRDPAFAQLVGRSDATLCVADSARAFVLAGLADTTSRSPVVAIAPTHGEAQRLSHDLGAFLSPDEVEMFPAWETLPFERVSPSVATMGQRLRVFHRLRTGDPTLKVVVAPIKAMIQRLGPHAELSMPVIINKGDTIDVETLVVELVNRGYRREYQVEHRGEIAVRGSIIDVFPSTADSPIRIDLWGDDVERLAEFSPADQRSTGDLDHVAIYGARELLPTDEVRKRAELLLDVAPWARAQWDKLAAGLSFDGMESLLPWLCHDELDDASGEHVLIDVVADSAQLVLIEPRRCRDRAAEVLDEEATLATALSATWNVPSDLNLPRLHVSFDRLLAHTKASSWSIVPVVDSPDTPTFSASAWGQGLAADAEQLVKRVVGLANNGIQVIVAADGPASAQRLAASFADVGLNLRVVDDLADVSRRWAGDESAEPVVVVCPLERGFLAQAMQLAILAEPDLTGRRTSRRGRSTRRVRAMSESYFDDLREGDYVTHDQHGVGRFHGMVKRSIGGVERDYLLLEYRGNDRLYIPSDQIDSIRPYTGSESPTLHKLGGSDWKSTKARVKSAVTEIAQELVVLYQRRQVAPGHSYPMDSVWQGEMEQAFPFNETVDQLKAIQEVKADMESSVPMDRLICGDVGFGKTEVAIRAAFKAVQDGKQVAVLVPTTLLARQHFVTFSERFSGFPVRVAMMSRFVTAKETKKIVAGLTDKTIDVVIGTHRLLAQDIKFGDLGLLVIDEEQRFGVDHKEQIKKLRTNVDVLTLSATPIPRTLEMSLTGIRDLTLLQTPPSERQPILTYVGEYDESALAEAIRRELLREGQVFYVHNRVKSIEDCARKLRELVPEARVAVAHGQMDEQELERIVIDFSDGLYDVLACTTIIESGIDMPSVNTLVVERSDLLGLGQLHQIRGRVGRAGQRAYAYLFYPRDTSLTEEAYERLRTIGEHTELGSGFKIAMRDLQIRGAGNLLGGTQSGHIAAVGYDLYVQMVTEAVSELKGEPVRQPAEIKLELPVDANLPRDYIDRDDLRLDAYRRLATVESSAQVDDIADEWTDRFGPIPAAAQSLLDVARLRAECVRTGVTEVSVVREVARISPIRLAASKEIRLKRLFPKAIYKPEPRQLQLPVKTDRAMVLALRDFLADMLPDTPEPGK